MQGKSNNNCKHLWFYLLYQKFSLARKHSLKKVVYTITCYLNFLYVAGYLKCSNDATKPNIHKYTNYDILEIWINRLSPTTQIFIALDYLILISEKNLHFKTKACDKEKIFRRHRSNWMHIPQIYFSNYVYLKDICKNLKGIGIIQVVSKLTIFINLWVTNELKIMKAWFQIFRGEA